MRGVIVGWGGQGKLTAQAMKLLGMDVVAACDINLDAFEPQEPIFGTYPRYEDLGDGRAYTNWQEMIELEVIDVLAVTTWSGTHAPITIAAAKAGIPYILGEKPMAHSLRAAREMINACRENGSTFAICHQRPGKAWRKYRQLKQMLTETHRDRFGEMRSILFSCGGARVGDLGSHFVDLFHWLTDSKVVRVMGDFDGINEPNPRDPNGSRGFKDPPGRIHMIFENGIRGTIDLSRNVALSTCMMINCTSGRAIVEEHLGINDRFDLHVRKGKRPLSGVKDYYTDDPDNYLEPIEFPGEKDPYAWDVFLADMLEELVADRPVRTGEDGYRELEVLIAAFISHENGNVWVDLPLSGEALDKVLPTA